MAVLKRMRRFKRRSVVRRRRKVRIKLPKSLVPEVKYLTKLDNSKSIKNNFFNSATSTLDGINNFYSDIFSLITKGTDDNNRVGDRIFVKFLTIHLYIQGCGDPVTPDPVYNFLIRVIVHNARFTAGSGIAVFFRGGSTTPLTHCKPDRRNFTVWYDKMFIMNNMNGFNAATNLGAGPIKIVKIKLPVYRNVGFDIAGATKDDNSVYSLSVGAYNMSGASGTLKQCACMDVCIRPYFTDS